MLKVSYWDQSMSVIVMRRQQLALNANCSYISNNILLKLQFRLDEYLYLNIIIIVLQSQSMCCRGLFKGTVFMDF